MIEELLARPESTGAVLGGGHGDTVGRLVEALRPSATECQEVRPNPKGDVPEF